MSNAYCYITCDLMSAKVAIKKCKKHETDRDKIKTIHCDSWDFVHLSDTLSLVSLISDRHYVIEEMKKALKFRLIERVCDRYKKYCVDSIEPVFDIDVHICSDMEFEKCLKLMTVQQFTDEFAHYFER